MFTNTAILAFNQIKLLFDFIGNMFDSYFKIDLPLVIILSIILGTLVSIILAFFIRKYGILEYKYEHFSVLLENKLISFIIFLIFYIILKFIFITPTAELLLVTCFIFVLFIFTND